MDGGLLAVGAEDLRFGVGGLDVQLGRPFGLLGRAEREQLGQAGEVLAQRLEHARRVERGGRDGRSGTGARRGDRASITSGWPCRRVMPVGSPRSSLVEKLPSVQITAGLDQLDLAQQVLVAVLDLERLGVAVAGRPALQGVRDEHVGALRARSPRAAVSSSLPGPADEREALLVLAGAGRLADEHQVGVGVAGAEDDGLAGRGQLGAARAGARLREHLLERLAALEPGVCSPELHRRMLVLPRGAQPPRVRDDPRDESRCSSDDRGEGPVRGRGGRDRARARRARSAAGAPVVVLEAMKMEHEVAGRDRRRASASSRWRSARRSRRGRCC